jgi:hypothetical protein
VQPLGVRGETGPELVLLAEEGRCRSISPAALPHEVGMLKVGQRKRGDALIHDKSPENIDTTGTPNAAKSTRAWTDDFYNVIV